MASTAGSQTSSSNPNEALVFEVLESYEYIQQGDSRQALRDLSELTESDAFDGLADALKREIYILQNRAITDRKGRRHTYETTKRITELASAQAADWLERMELSYGYQQDPIDAAYCLTQLLQRWPERLNELNADYVGDMLADSLSQAGDASVYLALVDALLAADWQIPGSRVSIDRAWFRTALQLIELNETDRALAAAKRIRFVPAVIGMRADKRFDQVREMSEDWFEIDAAIERELEVRQEEYGQQPNSLYFMNQLINALSRTHLPGDAISAINFAAQPRENSDPETATGWSDEMSQLPWFLSARADVLWRGGEHQDAIAQLQEARVVFTSPDTPHASQSISLGHYFALSGQPDRARAAVDDLDRLTNFGKLYVRYVRLLAAVLEENPDRVWREIEYIQDNTDDAVSLSHRAFIISGRLDDAAELLIGRLADENTRVSALIDIQRYRDMRVSGTSTSMESRFAEQFEALLERDDVSIAIESVGRVEDYPVWHADFSVRPDLAGRYD